MAAHLQRAPPTTANRIGSIRELAGLVCSYVNPGASFYHNNCRKQPYTEATAAAAMDAIDQHSTRKLDSVALRESSEIIRPEAFDLRWSSQPHSREVLHSDVLIRKDQDAPRLNRFVRPNRAPQHARRTRPAMFRNHPLSRGRPREDSTLGGRILAVVRACGAAIRDYWKPN